MKVNEITNTPSIQSITEAIEQSNDSGFATADLVEIVKAHRANKWQSFDADVVSETFAKTGKFPWEN
jgi:hypothetical protein